MHRLAVVELVVGLGLAPLEDEDAAREAQPTDRHVLLRAALERD